MKMLKYFAITALLTTPLANADNSTSPTQIYQATTGSGSADWSNYQTDTAPSSISAAGMLGLSGGAIATVESVKDVSVAINSLTSGGANSGLAISFTPARTAITPMKQQTYADS